MTLPMDGCPLLGPSRLTDKPKSEILCPFRMRLADSVAFTLSSLGQRLVFSDAMPIRSLSDPRGAMCAGLQLCKR
jgi:hypothetical protein